jgi:hypothetical protein
VHGPLSRVQRAAAAPSLVDYIIVTRESDFSEATGVVEARKRIGNVEELALGEADQGPAQQRAKRERS